MKRVSEDSRSVDMSTDSHFKVLSTMDQEDSSPLCCCEYRNVQGERTHLLAFFCDCEDLDNAVDQCVKGNPVPKEKLGAICNVIADRIRIPWPSGAIQIELGAALPFGILPALLYFASYGLVFTVLSLVYVPVFVIFYYLYVLRQRKKTWFFVSWGFVSVVGLFGLYLYYVAPVCSFLNTAAISLGFATMIFCYTQVLTSKARLQQFCAPSRSRSTVHSAENDKKGLEHLSCCFCTFGPFERAKHCR